jgi:hypothetical protein
LLTDQPLENWFIPIGMLIAPIANAACVIELNITSGNIMLSTQPLVIISALLHYSTQQCYTILGYYSLWGSWGVVAAFHLLRQALV